MFHRANLLFIALLLAAASGCTVAENTEPVDSVSEPDFTDNYWPTMAIVDWSQVDLTDPEKIAEFARADIIALETAYVWRDNLNPGALDEIRALNPDVRIVGYLNAQDSWLAWGNIDRSDAENPFYTWEWFQATKPYWSYTTEGDTMLSWPGKVLLNVLDENCRQAMVDVLVDHWSAHDNVLDGFYWDHFNSFLWVPIEIPGVEGEMDLDGDGIAHRDDEDEKQAYRDASEDLIRRVRRALGSDVIQIANGQRAPSDPEFAALFDGMFYENFPEYSFSGDELRQSLDPAVENNLFEARTWCRADNGGPWLILSNWGQFYAPNEDGVTVVWKRADLNRAIGLLAGCLSVYYPGTSYRYGWPAVDVDLGMPLGEAVQDGDLYTREFENGRVVLSFDEAAATVPFQFAIVEDGDAKQVLQTTEQLY